MEEIIQEHIKKRRFFKVGGVPGARQDDMCRTLDQAFHHHARCEAWIIFVAIHYEGWHDQFSHLILKVVK